MVEELDTEQAGGGLDGGGELQVGLAGCRVAGRMIVGDNDCIRVDLERLAENFAQLNCRRARDVSERDEYRLLQIGRRSASIGKTKNPSRSPAIGTAARKNG